MLLLPFEQFTLSTKLTDLEIMQRLEKAVEDPNTTNFSFLGNYTKPYRGQVKNSGFTISRNNIVRNSFKPIIIGEVSHSGFETKISIEMRMHILVIFFLIIFFMITGFFSIAAIVSQIQSGVFSSDLNIPLFMFVSFYLAVLIGFHTEKAKSKKFLKNIFAA